MNDNKDKLWPMLEKLGVKAKLKPADLDLMGKPLMKRIMQTWLRRRRPPRDDYLSPPLPRHRPECADTLYEGPLDDKYAEAIRNCDATVRRCTCPR